MASVDAWTGDVPGWATLPGGGANMMPSWGLVMDYWALAVLTALPAGLVRLNRLRRRIARRYRRQEGCCAKCGYDLRATPGRCPECGTETPAAKKIAPAV
jgi:hypothetical protein